MNLGEKTVLVVDLDGTLLRSDMLFESFWSCVSRDWRQVFAIPKALAAGRATLKQNLARQAQIDVKTLPYDSEIIDYVSAYRTAGGRTALVTATDQSIAEKIAQHLDIFDEVHGSDGHVNLKGQNKADFLNLHYGEKKYAYIGDSTADLHVWKHANQAITVNASPGLRMSVDRLGLTNEHLTTQTTSTKAYLKALRPHQWLKNVLVFLPMLAAHAFTFDAFTMSLIAFVAFSMVASSAYVVNDLLDLAADRAHPRKCQRPFAAGSLPISHGTWMASGLLFGGLGIALLNSAALLGIVLGYYLLTTTYSLYFKRRIVVDICILAGLYTVRIIAGAVATGLTLSVWMLAFSIFLFFSLAAVKRQAELVDMKKRNTLSTVGRGYHVDDMPIVTMMAVSAGYVSVLVMALYINTLQASGAYSTPEALWGICCILLFWITRVVMFTHRGWMHDDPVVYAAKDGISLISFLIMGCCAIIAAIL